MQEKLREDLRTVGNEVGHLWMHHDIFWKTVEVMNNNQQVLERGGDLLDPLRPIFAYDFEEVFTFPWKT